MLPVLSQFAQEPRTRDVIDNLARTPLSQVLIFAAVCTTVRLLSHFILSRTPFDERGLEFKLLRALSELMDSVVYAGVIVFMLIRPFLVQTFTIPTESMVQTLLVNDYIIANKAIYRVSDPQYNDIVVFKPPKAALRPGDGDIDFIKRCKGVPGDVIEIKDGVFYRNGVAEKEPFVYLADGFVRMSRNFKLVRHRGRLMPVMYIDDLANAEPGLTSETYLVETPEEMAELMALPAEPIPPGYYLMIGDNREGSFDGRAWGLVPRDNIIGKSVCIWLPFNRWQVTR